MGVFEEAVSRGNFVVSFWINLHFEKPERARELAGIVRANDDLADWMRFTLNRAL